MLAPLVVLHVQVESRGLMGKKHAWYAPTDSSELKAKTRSKLGYASFRLL